MSPISSKTTVAQCDLKPISSNRKVVHGVFHKLWLPNNTGQFGAKRRLRNVFWRQFRATGQLRTVFWTSLSFLTKVTNFDLKDSCARSFSKALAFQQYGPIWSKTTVVQCDLRPISRNSTVAHAAFYKFYLKQQIKLSWILLFIYTNLGRFSVARPL